MIGLEAIISPADKYKIVGIYDSSNGLYYVLYNGKETVLYNVASTPLPIVSTNSLPDITPEKFVAEQKDDFKDCTMSFVNDILYIKNIFDTPYSLTYIYTDDTLYKFDTDLVILYDKETDSFNYKNELYNLNLSHQNYFSLVANIKKEYLKLCRLFMDGKMTTEQSDQFIKEFDFCCEMKGENR